MKKLLNHPLFRFVVWLAIIAAGAVIFKAGHDFGFFMFFITLICGSPLLITGYAGEFANRDSD